MLIEVEKFLEEKEKEGKVIDTPVIGQTYNILVDSFFYGKFSGKALINLTEEDNKKFKSLKDLIHDDLRSF